MLVKNKEDSVLIKRETGLKDNIQRCVTIQHNGTAGFKKCKQLFEYLHLFLFRDIW
jgi:hypothetical protein